MLYNGVLVSVYNKVNQLYIYIYPHISSLLCLKVFCFMRCFSKYLKFFFFGFFVFFLLCLYTFRNSLSVICVLRSFYFYFLNDIFEGKFLLIMSLNLSKIFSAFSFTLLYSILHTAVSMILLKTQTRIYHFPA